MVIGRLSSRNSVLLTLPPPLKLILANIGKVSTGHAAKKKPKRGEWYASIIAVLAEWGGEGVGNSKKTKTHDILYFSCFLGMEETLLSKTTDLT